ncbi:AraC family transcriptional regulator [Parapedobacter tibetensis]|uniref:AraC family transcriptional regulator n=1 Tax=Parapedobacter tibetensis TaxID=2972951 RepID=UPI00214D24B2|nr:helix-turn-helix domain-containing protein [Parapedobacter tibetensis]
MWLLLRPKKIWFLHFVPFLFFLVFSLVYLLPSFFNIGVVQHAGSLCFPGAVFFGVTALTYLTLTQRSIYAIEPYQPVATDEGFQKKPLYERLTPQQVDELKNRVLIKTTAEKLHLDPSLTLSVLSDKTGISAHELSYVLNNGLDKNFYQFINELRTEEAKSLLLSKETSHLDMLGVATRAGFNSKTTFYTTFKKATGDTPGIPKSPFKTFKIACFSFRCIHPNSSSSTTGYHCIIHNNEYYENNEIIQIVDRPQHPRCRMEYLINSQKF